MAKHAIILVRAINGKEVSKPIKVYRTDPTADLPKQFVLRIDEGVNNQTGEETLKLHNSNIGIFASHNPDWLTEALTGYRRDIDDVTCVICEQLVDSVPTLSKLNKVEAY